MAKRKKADKNATDNADNIEFELPDTPFAPDAPADAQEGLSHERPVASGDNNAEADTIAIEDKTGTLSETSESDKPTTADEASESDKPTTADEASESDKPTTADEASEGDNPEAIGEAIATPCDNKVVESKTGDTRAPSEGESAPAAGSESESIGIADDGEEFETPNEAPSFETVEVDISEDAVELMVGAVAASDGDTGDSSAVDDTAAASLLSDADNPRELTEAEEPDTQSEEHRQSAKADTASPFEENTSSGENEACNPSVGEDLGIPEDIFPDDAFAEPKLDDEGNPIVTDLLGNRIEDEEESEPAEAESALKDDAAPEEIHDAAPPITEESYNPDKPRRIDAIFDFVELLVFTLVSVLCLTSFFIRHAVVEGGSMMNTLTDGDVLLISDLFYTPTPGDIIVVEDYTTMLKKPIVKRVIAVEGQIVRVEKDAIYVNGQRLSESYVFTDDPEYEYPIVSNEELRSLPGFIITREYYEFMVPEGEIFVMGDHRDDSTDSRVIGTVKVEAVLGRALLRLYPFEKFGELK